MRIEPIIALSGGTRAVARACEVTPQAVSMWTRVPHDKVLKLARARNYAVTPHMMRRDLYPYPDDGLPPQLRGNGKHRRPAARRK